MRLHPPILFVWTLACSEYDLKNQAEAHPSPAAPEDTGFTPSTEPPEDTGVPPDCSDFMPAPAPTVGLNEECLREPTVGSFTPVSVAGLTIPTQVHQIVSARHRISTMTTGMASLTTTTPPTWCSAASGAAYTSPAPSPPSAAATAGLSPSPTPAARPSTQARSGHRRPRGRRNRRGALLRGTHAVVCVNGEAEASSGGRHGASDLWMPVDADLDGDGLAEVIHGRTIFGHDGTVIGQGTGGLGGGYLASFAVDWDDDGRGCGRQHHL